MMRQVDMVHRMKEETEPSSLLQNYAATFAQTVQGASSPALAALRRRLETDEPAFRREWAAEVQQAAHKMRALNRGVLNPRSSRMQYWDMATALALVFTAIVTPFEVWCV